MVLPKGLAAIWQSEYISALILRVEQYDLLKLKRLRKELQLGVDELDRGEGVPFNRNKITKEIEQELGYAA